MTPGAVRDWSGQHPGQMNGPSKSDADDEAPTWSLGWTSPGLSTRKRFEDLQCSTRFIYDTQETSCSSSSSTSPEPGTRAL